jgi:beta-phosphoglucomutase-like phosphatase (HAD superfamily)
VKLFLSHAVIDKELAAGVKRLIQEFSMGLIEVWQSSAIDGLKPGDILWDEVHENLTKSSKIITLVTPNSIDRPWLTYESGYVAGKQGAQVIPLLYGLKKNELPSPLSAYVVYCGDDKTDLETLLVQLISTVAPNPSSVLASSLAGAFLKENQTVIDSLNKAWSEKAKLNAMSTADTTYVSKLEASELLHKRLADPNVHLVQILTYTNEVEAGSINTYRVKGKKRLEIYKRSILTDLRQQQRVNLYRVAQGLKVKLWDKKRKSIDASSVIDKEFESSNEVDVVQFLFDSPPAKRAYVFDESEAIVSYYETYEDPLVTGGSIYKGMEGSQNVHVDKTQPLGAYIIGELVHYIHSLRVNSRTWNEERRLIEHPDLAPRWVQMPCLVPKAVLVDLDGVLYDSLPQYEQAWVEAFKEIALDLPVEEVYLQEGRSGESTVSEITRKFLRRQATKDEIATVVSKKRQILNSFGIPPIQSGAKELVDSIARTGLEIFVVTGSTMEGIRERIIHDFPEVENVKHIVTGDDVRYGKPNPEPYLLACERAALTPSEVVVIENAPLGVRAAVEAGCLCICVNTGPLDGELLTRSGATVIFPTCGELAKQWDRVVGILRG